VDIETLYKQHAQSEGALARTIADMRDYQPAGIVETFITFEGLKFGDTPPSPEAIEAAIGRMHRGQMVGCRMKEKARQIPYSETYRTYNGIEFAAMRTILTHAGHNPNNRMILAALDGYVREASLPVPREHFLESDAFENTVLL
jgi:hypothetical protein